MAVLDVIVGYVRGLKGDTGDTGATGATGDAATVSVGTVSTTAYGQPAQVTNSGTSGAAVLDFVIPEGRPGDGISDMSDLTNNTVTPSTSSYPIPSAGDTGRVLWGKVQKFFADIRSAVESKLDSDNVYNGLDKTDSGYALDARQGKALYEAKLDTSKLYNGLDQTSSGYALDARKGKALKDTIDAVFNTAEYKILQKNGSTSDNNTIMTEQATNTVKIYWGQNEQNAPAINSLHTILSARYGNYGQQYAFYGNKCYFRGWSESGGFSAWTYVPTMVGASITGTTSAQGNLMILGNGSVKMVCATSGNKICVPFLSGSHWFVKVFDTSNNIIANTEVTIDFTYFL